MSNIFTYLWEDKVFFFGLCAALISMVWGDFQWTYINWDVIVSLFGMMLVLELFTASGMLDVITVRFMQWSQDTRQLSLRMVWLAFFCSMILSNDIAVLTLLPLYLMASRETGPFKGQLVGAAFITIAANLGGVIFPFSNPQNLIIYMENQWTLVEFLALSLPLTLFSFLLVTALPLIAVEQKSLQKDQVLPTLDQSKLRVASFCFILMVLAIVGPLSLGWITAIVTGISLFYLPQVFKHVNYRLLMTFACFFIIVGNVGQWQALTKFFTQHLTHPLTTYVTSFTLSQFFSNVPTTILLLPFTPHTRSLWYGVNIGGLGSLLASLANLIGYQMVRSYQPAALRPYLKVFLSLNIIIAIILSLFYLLMTLGV